MEVGEGKTVIADQNAGAAPLPSLREDGHHRWLDRGYHGHPIRLALQSILLGHGLTDQSVPKRREHNQTG